MGYASGESLWSVGPWMGLNGPPGAKLWTGFACASCALVGRGDVWSSENVEVGNGGVERLVVRVAEIGGVVGLDKGICLRRHG